jgi:hypothetical protein
MRTPNLLLVQLVRELLHRYEEWLRDSEFSHIKFRLHFSMPLSFLFSRALICCRMDVSSEQAAHYRTALLRMLRRCLNVGKDRAVTRHNIATCFSLQAHPCSFCSCWFRFLTGPLSDKDTRLYTVLQFSRLKD